MMMDPLDYDGMFLSGTDAAQWMLSPFDQQDATFLSSSRQMLETIVEETSDDEEIHQSWSQFDNVWSEESDTGSVIRIELHNDQDSISERDFACPPKRPRRDDLLTVDELSTYGSNIIRKFPRNENLLISEFTTDIPPVYRNTRRFDEPYSDSDTLSYNSLSRSSSLIQFESLERQFQGGDLAATAGSILGQSSPSLTTYGHNGDRKIADDCIRRYESSDGRLHQTYYDLAKIEFNNDLIFHAAKSDSESSDNSILSHEERVLKTTTTSTTTSQGAEAEGRTNGCRTASEQRACYKGKNSAENLSEDSGYCENFSALRVKSKSIPNFLRSNEKFCEEEEFFENHKSLEMIYEYDHSRDENDGGRRRRHDDGDMDVVDDDNDGVTKIAGKHECGNGNYGWYNGDVKNKMYREQTTSPSLSRSASSSPSTTSSTAYQRFSSSLPNVRLQSNQHDSDALCGSFHLNRDRYAFSDSDDNGDGLIEKSQLRAVVSVPSCLYLNDGFANDNNDHRQLQNIDNNNDRDDVDFEWTPRSPKFVRSQNRSSGGKKYLTSKKHSVATTSAGPSTPSYLNASYNNLTLLDYSGNRNSFNMSDYSGNSKRSSREFELGKGNFLLDEISSHFDRNLSILSGREADSDLISEFLKGERTSEQPDSLEETEMRGHSEENLVSVEMRKVTAEIDAQKAQRKNSSLETFDVNPTNLKTSYAESLESCNFDLGDHISHLDHSTPIKRGLVASTPNLSSFNSPCPDDSIEDQMLSASSAHNSMAAIPGEGKRLGILISGTAGSRNSLGKGVSFCPFVSEISFVEQSSEEAPDEPDSLENYSLIATTRHEFANQPTADQEPSSSSIRNTAELYLDRENIDVDAVAVSDLKSANPSNCVGVAQTSAQVLAANSEIINKQQRSNERTANSVGPGCDPQGFNNSPSIASNSNESIVEQCGSVSDSGNRCGDGGGEGLNSDDYYDDHVLVQAQDCAALNCDIPITVEMFSSDEMSGGGPVNVPTADVDDSDRGHSPNSVREIVAKINNNNNSNSSNNNCSIRSSLNSNGNGNHQQQQIRCAEQSNYGNNQKMPNIEVDSSMGGVGTGGNGLNTNMKPPAPNTGTDLLSAKFKPKPDEKRHKNGFLSRFAGGFRFSLRRKKKAVATGADKNFNEPQPLNYSQQTTTTTTTTVPQQQAKSGQVANSDSKHHKSKLTPDYVYIPLKDPSPVRQLGNAPAANDNRSPGYDTVDKIATTNTSSSSTTPERRHLPFGAGTNNIDKNHVLIASKPPLPKQPPRVVGVCEKVRAGPQALSPAQQYQTTLSMLTNGGAGSPANGRHAPVYRSKSQPREIDERFLDAERNFFYNTQNQLIATMNGNGCTQAIPYVLEGDDDVGGGGGGGGNKSEKAQTLPMDASNISASKIGLIETNLDTHETVITGKTRSLMELGPGARGHPDRILHHHHNHHNSHHHGNVANIIDGGATKRPHKSMEFLLDKENQKNVLPPENELQKSHDNSTALSEHQLRVQASLQRLNIPDWFRQYNSTPKTEPPGGYKLSNFNRKRASESGRWTGLNSKTTSLSSLGSQRSDRSPLMLSPSAHSHHGGQTGFSRWSTSHLNSTQTSPSVSTRGSFSRGAPVNSSFISGHSVSGVGVRNSFRQPYLGWRSQEKLAMSQPRTPHERLASSVLAQHHQQHSDQSQQQGQTQQEPPVTPEIQSSIKEVTSAIVHYVNDQTNRTSSRSRSTSPSSRKCWVESSFVGIKPVESPQTPVIENSFSVQTTTGVGAGGVHKSGATINTSSTHSGTDILHMNGVGESTII